MGVTGSQKRMALLGVSAVCVVAGVGLSLGIGPALIVAGVCGAVVAVAWAYIAVTE
jgi:hypothetical protein